MSKVHKISFVFFIGIMLSNIGIGSPLALNASEIEEIPVLSAEGEEIPSLTELEVKERIADGTLPEEYAVLPRERCYYQCSYYRYTTISKTNRSNNVYLRDHPSWGWLYDSTKRSFCTGKISKTISTSISIGGKGFSVGVGYAPEGSGTFDCVNSVNKSGKTKVRPTIRGDKYILKQKVEKITNGKVVSTSTKTTGVTVNEQLGLRYA